MAGSSGSFIWMLLSCLAIITVYLVTPATPSTSLGVRNFPCMNHVLWPVLTKKNEHGFNMKLCVSVRVQESLHSNDHQNQTRFLCSKWVVSKKYNNSSVKTALSSAVRSTGNSDVVFPYKMIAIPFLKRWMESKLFVTWGSPWISPGKTCNIGAKDKSCQSETTYDYVCACIAYLCLNIKGTCDGNMLLVQWNRG